jgi:hypothetical protein
MFAWGVGVVSPNLEGSILHCECEHVSASPHFTIEQSTAYVRVLYISLLRLALIVHVTE